MADEVRREWFDKDYYQILGVPKNATPAEVKKAYRKLAQQFHPDANPGNKDAEDRFKEIAAAHDVIGDEDTRKSYDQVREMSASGFGPGSSGGGPAAAGAAWPGGAGGQAGWPGGFAADVDLGDLLSGMFAGGGRRGQRQVRPQRGADLETDVRISFDDSMKGTTVPVRISGPATCRTCSGSGAAPGTSPVTCPQCGGAGQVAVNQGVFSMAQPCPRCRGNGRIVETPCSSCHGSGAEQRTRSFKVKIPAGVKADATIKLAGRGEPGPAGGHPGDLYVRVRVNPDEVFARSGDNLTVELPITFAEAALGARVEVPTMNGPLRLKVPPGTPTGKTFRLKGKGAPKPNKSGHGDLMVKVKVDVPEKLSRDEKRLLEELREAQKESPRAKFGVA